MGSQLTSWVRQENDFLTLAVLFAAFRLMVLVMFRPGGNIVDFSTSYIFHDLARLSDRGFYPYLDYWMEYPPLAGWPPVLAYRLSAFMPPWQDSHLWFTLTLGLFYLPFEIGNLILVYLLGTKMHGRQTGFRCAWMYAALFVPVLVFRAELDTLPLFLLLLSVYLIVVQRPGWAGLAIGTGFMVKLLPVLILPIGLRGLFSRLLPGYWRDAEGLDTSSSRFIQRGLILLAATALTVLAIASPFYVLNPDNFVASFRNILARPPWETIWALLDGYYGGGLVADISLRLDPRTATQFSQAARISWTWLFPLLALSFLALLGLRARWNKPQVIVASSAVALNLFLLLSKGYSPQFLAYVLPFVVLLLPGLKGTLYAIALSIVNLMEFPVALAMLPNQPSLLAAMVILRTGLLLMLTFDFLHVVLARRSARWWRVVSGGAVFGSLGVVCFLALNAGQGYFADRLADEQYREAVTFLQAETPATVLITDRGTYSRLFPFLGQRHRVYVVDPDYKPADLLPRTGLIYLIDGGSEDDQRRIPAMERWLTESAYPIDIKWVKNARLLEYSAANITITSIEEGLEDHIRLTGYGTEVAVDHGGVLDVGLRWQTDGETKGDYHIFVHLTDHDGRPLAQRDSIPQNGLRPTGTWVHGSTVIDNHALRIPADLPPGTYRLIVGLYDPGDGKRLKTGSGQDHIDLAQIQVK